jgi:MarR family transcriptional regulator, lower aerobic nicotinate degradation pathway regulator
MTFASSASVSEQLPPYAVGQLLRRAHARAARAFGEALTPLGIEGRHFGVLAVLAARGSQTQRDLVVRVGSDRVSMMRIVDDLEARKLAVRRAVPGDRRLRAVELTEHGREVFHTAEKTARETSEALLAHLEPAERTALTGLLSRFLQATDT